jgi:hypothetical protein
MEVQAYETSRTRLAGESASDHASSSLVGQLLPEWQFCNIVVFMLFSQRAI